MINFYYIDSTGTAYEHSGQEGERDLAKEKVVSTWPLAWGQFHLECQQTEHEVIVVVELAGIHMAAFVCKNELGIIAVLKWLPQDLETKIDILTEQIFHMQEKLSG